MLDANEKSYIICHVSILYDLKEFELAKRCLIDWILQVKLNWIKLYVKIIYKNHILRELIKEKNIIWIFFLKVKHSCQLMVRLKANECYQGLLYYLSSYISFLIIRLF